jgi:hypothetical protein
MSVQSILWGPSSRSIDRLIGWIPSLEALQLWAASSFDYPLTLGHLEGHLRESAEREILMSLLASECEALKP